MKLPKKASDVEYKAIKSTLVDDIHCLIHETKSILASTVNSALTILYWKIGHRIHTEILNRKRAEYGEQVVKELAEQLETKYGRGFSIKNLRHMVHFAEIFAEEKIVLTLSRQLAWSHFLTLIYIKDDLKRQFYTEMCRLEGWSVRTLRQRIDSMLFDRTTISHKSDELIKQELDSLRESDQLSPQLLLKDPYILDFLGLQDRYLEKDLEDAILRELENFLLELGTGFSFVARQKRLQIDNDDFYIDLLFYNRRLKRLVAIELKLGEFKAAYKGQMELYLRWLAKYEQEPGEAPPLGIILCAGKKREQIELLELDQSGIHVAEYVTGLPNRQVLEQKLHDAVALSKARFENKNLSTEDNNS